MEGVLGPFNKGVNRVMNNRRGDAGECIWNKENALKQIALSKDQAEA